MTKDLLDTSDEFFFQNGFNLGKLEFVFGRTGPLGFVHDGVDQSQLWLQFVASASGHKGINMGSSQGRRRSVDPGFGEGCALVLAQKGHLVADFVYVACKMNVGAGVFVGVL